MTCAVLCVYNYKVIVIHIYIMKSTLKVHNPRVIILFICINDVQGKELSFQLCNIRKYGSTFYIGIAMVVLPYFGPWEN